MFRLLHWIPGCRTPRHIRYHSEKSPPPVIPDIGPTFSHVPPPTRPIPESHYHRRLIDEDFPQVIRNPSYEAKYQKYQYPHPMQQEVTPSPLRHASPQPRVPRRGSSRRARGGRSNLSTRAHDSSQNNAVTRRRIADETLAAIERGEIQHQGSTYRFRDVVSHSIDNTIHFPPESILATWSTSAPASSSLLPAQLELCQGSTLQRARALLQELNATSAGDGDGPPRVGVLSFASATKPGGGFLSGAHAQEESLARASTLYASLVTSTSTRFYDHHKRDRRGGFYSHAMIFSPSVIVLRDDAGRWVPPYQIEVVTSAAVNAGVVRERAGENPDPDIGARIEGVMRERMARILFLFEQQGIRNIVLGSFGTGVFRNDVSMIADIWFDLLAEEGARFMHSFDRVVFGIIDSRTLERFKAVFQSRIDSQSSTSRGSETTPETPRSVLRVVE
ncbi:hypothetical protein F5148DRAFT_1170718 [Russula earlei]|uniref:Uncharacterized protein n=1 Tax=Russula earlei TaxID=71964 RepID=A0ACC0UKX5_9AGAM|nr:hypothetical protein F5148DRAFT_1170718 [Russula earlei]